MKYQTEKMRKSLKLKVISLKKSTNWKACTHNDQGKADRNYQY